MFKILIPILKRKKYAVIALVTALIMAALTYYLTVVNIFHKSLFAYAAMNGTGYTIISLTLGLMIAVLFGCYIALLVFRREIVKARAVGNKAASFTGTVTGILAAGCPSCGAPILGLIGLPLGLFSLPFRGIELKVLSIGFLLLSIYLISKNIKKNLACERAVE
jgi:hypothetical protein